ncbi:MAG TPA: hypothetical protein VKX17_25460 [Planctomycetota bacterium]|nr:hypothetical protein [Planctomycetota bacterium]
MTQFPNTTKCVWWVVFACGFGVSAFTVGVWLERILSGTSPGPPLVILAALLPNIALMTLSAYRLKSLYKAYPPKW